MRPVAILLLVWALSVPANPVQSQSTDRTDNAAATDGQSPGILPQWVSTAFDLSAGYRTDQLNWNIAGNLQGSDPNVLSEVSWSELKIYQIKLTNRTIVKERVYTRGHLSYGVVTAGSNRDSDYNGDNRTLEYSRSLNGVDGNNVWDASIGIGPRFSFFGSDIALCPMIGYAVSEQDLNIVDGYQVLSNPPPNTAPVGPIAGLDSRYETSWKGPWIGLDLLLSIPRGDGPFNHVGVIFSGEYHWVDYSADANWNLRTDYQHPVSFSHEADGKGFMAGVSLVFSTKNRWGINVGMNFRKMTTDAGEDRVYFADGTTAATRLNEVQWQSLTFDAGFSYRF